MIDHQNQAFVSACKEGQLFIANRIYMQHQDVIDFAYHNHEAIRLAAENGHLDVVNALLKTPGVDPSAIDQYALRAASENGHDQVVALLLAHHLVEPSARNHRALSMACQNGHVRCVEHLLKSNQTSALSNNAYPLRLAIKYQHYDVLAVILEYDSDARRHMQNHYSELLQQIYNANAWLGYALAERNIPIELAESASIYIRGHNVFKTMLVGYHKYQNQQKHHESGPSGNVTDEVSAREINQLRRNQALSKRYPESEISLVFGSVPETLEEDFDLDPRVPKSSLSDKTIKRRLNKQAQSLQSQEDHPKCHLLVNKRFVEKDSIESPSLAQKSQRRAAVEDLIPLSKRMKNPVATDLAQHNQIDQVGPQRFNNSLELRKSK